MYLFTWNCWEGKTLMSFLHPPMSYTVQTGILSPTALHTSLPFFEKIYGHVLLFPLLQKYTGRTMMLVFRCLEEILHAWHSSPLGI